MRVLVGVTRDHDGVREIAPAIAEELTQKGLPTTVSELGAADPPEPYDAVVLRGTRHVGKWMTPDEWSVATHHGTLERYATWMFSLDLDLANTSAQRIAIEDEATPARQWANDIAAALEHHPEPSAERHDEAAHSERSTLRRTHFSGRRLWALMLVLGPAVVLIGLGTGHYFGGGPAIWIATALAVALGISYLIAEILFEVDDGEAT